MSNRINLDDPNYDQNRVTIQDNKAKKLWIVLGILAIGVIIVAFVLQNGNSSGSSGGTTLDPNRTWESCSLYGETRVFGAVHTDRTNCISDGDGYYNPVFGHHHHK